MRPDPGSPAYLLCSLWMLTVPALSTLAGESGGRPCCCLWVSMRPGLVLPPAGTLTGTARCCLYQREHSRGRPARAGWALRGPS